MSRLRVVFDLDDTLYPERQFALSGFCASARWAEATFGVIGLDVEMARLLDEGMLGNLFPIVLARHVPSHTSEQLQQFIHAYRTCEPELELFEDAPAVLEYFRANGPIGLITDGALATQQSKVKALGIAPKFARIIFTDELGADRAYFKPHPKAFEMMEAAIGDIGDRFVYVGDNPAKDFIAPNTRGWITVQVVRDEGGIHDREKFVAGGAARHRVRSLADLPTVFAGF